MRRHFTGICLPKDAVIKRFGGFSEQFIYTLPATDIKNVCLMERQVNLFAGIQRHGKLWHGGKLPAQRCGRGVFSVIGQRHEVESFSAAFLRHPTGGILPVGKKAVHMKITFERILILKVPLYGVEFCVG